MSATDAAPSTVGLARLIALSNDMKLPSGFRSRMGCSEFDSYQLQTLYGVLDWLRDGCKRQQLEFYALRFLA